MGKPRILLALLALAQLTCNQAIMTAPSGSTLTLRANPNVIASNGGVSVISALVIEPVGTVVADGTVVQFFTTLGEIDEQGKTNDGVARVNLRATGRSGVANITAVSGGEAAPAPSPTPAPAGAVGVSAAASSIGPAAAASDSVTVAIGNINAKSIKVIADPPRITTSHSTQIRANVFDEFGNTLAGVPVFFEVSAGGATNFMDSAGTPRFTDSNGQAFDVMRTRNTASGTATVKASVPNGTEGFLVGTVDVEIVFN